MKTYIVYFAALLLITACGDSTKEQAPIAQQLPPAQVKLRQANAQQTANNHSFSATVKANKQATLSTRLMGQIAMLEVSEGDLVQAGQTLIRIKSTDIEANRAQVKANLIEAQAALQNAKRDYERMQALFDKQSATQKELDDMQTRYQMAQAKIEAIQEMQKGVSANLDYATITAPFTGYVVKKMANAGDMANPGQPILMIEVPDDFEVIAKVPESDISLFEMGDPVEIFVEAISETKLTGKVARINPAGGYGGAQYEVKIELTADKNQRKALKSGMYARLTLQKGKAEGRILVPETAIVRRGQLEGLFTVNQQNEAMLRWVRTGKKANGQVEILSGLDDGEQYVVSYEGKLQDGQPISQ